VYRARFNIQKRFSSARKNDLSHRTLWAGTTHISSLAYASLIPILTDHLQPHALPVLDQLHPRTQARATVTHCRSYWQRHELRDTMCVPVHAHTSHKRIGRHGPVLLLDDCTTAPRDRDYYDGKSEPGMLVVNTSIGAPGLARSEFVTRMTGHAARIWNDQN